jgi:hypothetical protein
MAGGRRGPDETHRGTDGGVAVRRSSSATTARAIRDPQNRTRLNIVADNNLPFSIGRFVDRAADNEFILLGVPELLQAR